MSWKRSGQLISGPPTLSDRPTEPDASAGTWGPRLVDRLKQNTGGLSAFQRERQLVARYGDYGVEAGGSGSGKGKERGKTEWDVLKENHRFIREDEQSGEVSWEERLARAYESKLFKEYALIDLKHYKSKRFALRWRTAPEVVEGIGEETCGSLRCKRHRPAAAMTPASAEYSAGGVSPDRWDSEHEDSNRHGRSSHRDRSGTHRKRTKHRTSPSLRAFELPFVYQEAGERKEALVKVRLCRRCEAKLKWKPEEEVEKDRQGSSESGNSGLEDEEGKVQARRSRHYELERAREKGSRELDNGDDDARYEKNRRRSKDRDRARAGNGDGHRCTHRETDKRRDRSRAHDTAAENRYGSPARSRSRSRSPARRERVDGVVERDRKR